MSSERPEPESSTVARICPNILTYDYASRRMWVATSQNYDEAIDIAQESFPELRDVDRDRIRLDVLTVLRIAGIYQPKSEKKTEISRSAWSAAVTTLVEFEVVDIRVAPPSNSAAAASSSSTTSAVAPPPYSSGTDWPSDVKGSQMTIVSNSPQISRSSSRIQSLANRFANIFTSKIS